jgi:hypothetical protein
MVVKPIRPGFTLFAVFSAAALSGRTKRLISRPSGTPPGPPECPQEALYGPVAPSMRQPGGARNRGKSAFPYSYWKTKASNHSFFIPSPLNQTSQADFLLHRVRQLFANLSAAKIRDPSRLFNPWLLIDQIINQLVASISRRIRNSNYLIFLFKKCTD